MGKSIKEGKMKEVVISGINIIEGGPLSKKFSRK